MTAEEIADKYYRELDLDSLSDEEKTLLAEKLLDSIKKENKKKSEDNDWSFFDEISGAWDDGTTVEEQVKMIRDSRTSGLTRKLDF